MQAKNFLKTSIVFCLTFLAGCGLPKVTLHQLDTVHSVANPFKIKNYNEETCKLETEELPSHPINDGELHGGFCLTKEDFAKIKTKLQTDCQAKKKEKDGNGVN